MDAPWLSLAGRSGPRKRRLLTRQGTRAAAPDLVRRPFTAVAPDLPAGRGHDTDRGRALRCHRPLMRQVGNQLPVCSDLCWLERRVIHVLRSGLDQLVCEWLGKIELALSARRIAFEGS